MPRAAVTTVSRARNSVMRGAGGRQPSGYCGSAVIDLHAHLLPGLADGPASLAASVEMARAAHEAGIRPAACPPHVSERFPTEPATVVEAVRVLAAALEAAAVPRDAAPGPATAPAH